MNALGHQGRAALAIVPAARLSAMSPREREELIHPAPAILRAPSIGLSLDMTDAPPIGVPAIAAVRLAADREDERRNAERSELATLRERVTELEIEVAHLSRQLEEAREQGRRDEREVKARTMGGQVLSIFVGGKR